ncbi:signal transduction protein, with PAS, HAMP, GGDEF and EAL domainsl [Catenovulum agarivorans DS-2]|uniref:Signal transduction protein, with PAS, HAMP, GGDEF and EAL domainsl n=1 Tax=Catenovulum agarivorans DS-2 TaxID=1328313 RepID=W7QWQ8_9ALTE|nr:EAL domain-containing protein [Catenovulum agarivorans]EWH09700.1 signal transduction protein, with PAS, HAMP, GGDEF and EAL domainsl [Catenovulum agarivorans DS-2]
MNLTKHSLKFSIISRLLILFVATLSIIGVTISIVERNLAQEKLTNDLNVIGEILSNRTIAALVFNDVSAAATNLSAAQFHESIEAICLYSQDKRFFASYYKQAEQIKCQNSIAALSEASTLYFDNSMEIVKPVVDGNEVMGALRIYSNLDYVENTQQHVILVIVSAILIAIFAVYIIANHLLKRVLAPLQHLHTTARHITQNVFSDIRAYKAKDDEVGQLVDVFNNMLDSLADEHNLLHLSEQRFRTLADQAPIGIFLRDENDKFLYVNNTWKEMTGCGLPINLDEYKHRISHSDKLRVIQVYDDARADNRSSSVEYRFATPQGTRKNFLEKMSPITLDDGRLSGYIGSVLDITELKDARHELERMAFQDPLTGLANRRFFNEHLKLEIANAQKLHQQLAVLMIDLDHFKRVNDTKGHEFGDDLLISVAEKLSSVVDDDDLVSRMGGDEFMVLIREVDSSAELDAVVKKLLNAVLMPLEHQSLLDVTTSIGVAVYPKDGENVGDLVRNADIALYKAKDFGRNQAVYFSQTLDTEIKNKVRLEHKLRNAIVNEELKVYLQPQYDATKQKFVWAEALVRWIDKDEGFIPPDKFIAVAEETGLIHELGFVVLRKVCWYMQTYQEQLSAIGIEGIAVNISARQLFAKNFFEQAMAIIGEYQIEPRQIEFEVTESLLMENAKQAVEVMGQFKRQGIKLAMDDFGTGYSSLAYLKHFPIDCVKIDRSFIKDIPEDKLDMELSSAIIAMALKLGLEIVAEGVETQEQSAFIHSQGCRLMQGYYFARPMPIEEVLLLASVKA